MSKQVSLKRVKALLLCIHGGGEGSARFYQDVYQAASEGGYMVFRGYPSHMSSDDHPRYGIGWFLTDSGLSLIKE